MASESIVAIIFLALVISPPPSDEGKFSSPGLDSISESFNKLVALIEDVASIFRDTFSRISKAISSILVMVGVILWSSHIDRRLGKDLILGAILLTLIAQVVLFLF